MDASSERKPGTEKNTQMSLSEAGQFDWARKQAGTWRNTRWHDLSVARHKAGASRKTLIRRKKEAA